MEFCGHDFADATLLAEALTTPSCRMADAAVRDNQRLEFLGDAVLGMIAAERLAGVPILSDNSTGYYLPGDDAEKVQFIRSMKHRAQEIERAAEAIEKAKG